MKKLLLTVALLIITIPVGQGRQLHKETFTSGRTVLEYCGMVSNSVFAISTGEYRSAVNTFYHKNTPSIIYQGKTLYIVSVTPYELKVSMEKPNETKTYW